LRGPRRAAATWTGLGRTAASPAPTAAAAGAAPSVTATPPSRSAAGSFGHPVATLRGPDVAVLNSAAGSGGATADSSGSDSIRAAWDSVGASTCGRAYGLRAGRPPRSPSVTALPSANRSGQRRAHRRRSEQHPRSDHRPPAGRHRPHSAHLTPEKSRKHRCRDRRQPPHHQP